MWAHGMSTSAMWVMGGLMGLATIGFWVLVAWVARRVITRPELTEYPGHTPWGTAGPPPTARPHAGVTPPPLPLPDPAPGSPDWPASESLGERANPLT